MNEPNLPRHIIDKLERRWARRLAGEAAAWRNAKPAQAEPTEIIDRAGRPVPVTFKRTPLRKINQPAAQRIA